MLQQILRDLYVDPKILAELDEQQKQTLFCKMREEQVRRWKDWDQKLGDNPPKICTSRNSKKVTFLKGSDGEPWVWVMGEHKNDKTIEEILKEEAIDKARKLAEKEQEELRKKMTTFSDYIDLTPKIEDLQSTPKLKIEDDMDIYCSVDELREKIANNKPQNINNYTLNHYQTKNNIYNLMDRDVLQEISLNTQKVSHKVALWEKRLSERTSEIFNTMQEKQLEAAKEAEEAAKRQEEVWREQERKAKEAEQQIREIARRAREEHRLACSRESSGAVPQVPSAQPPSRQAVLDWYRSTERQKGAGLDAYNNAEPWFHGLIDRSEAEGLLKEQPEGSFLVRLSERIWGYAVSYRAKDKCKHYLVSAEDKYNFLGNNQIEHKTLGDLIEYHTIHPLTGGEKFVRACPRSPSSTAISELIGKNN